MAKLFAFLRLCVVERLFVVNSIHCGANLEFILNISVASLTLYISESLEHYLRVCPLVGYIWALRHHSVVPPGLQSSVNFHSPTHTRGRVFPPISKHREVGWKNEAQPSFFKPTSRCLEMGGNTLSSV